MNTYTPLAVLEAIAEQRRPDPRHLAAAGYPPPRPRAQRRRQLGALLIRLGHRIQGPGTAPDPAPEPA